LLPFLQKSFFRSNKLRCNLVSPPEAEASG
jgi:hypothetical protein